MGVRDGVTAELIRRWRRARSLSQVELASLARTSVRNLSFIENGRSSPSEALLERLCKALQLSAGDRHVLLQAAGYGSPYAAQELDAARGAQLDRALDLLLNKMAPYPAGVMDRHFRLLRCNTAADRFIEALVRNGALDASGEPSVLELMMGPNGLAQYIVNHHEMTQRLINRLHREAAMGNASEEMAELGERLRAAQEAAGMPAPVESDSHPIMRFEIQKGELELRIDGLITTIGTPTDASFQHLRLTCFLPADDATDAFFQSLESPSAS